MTILRVQYRPNRACQRGGYTTHTSGKASGSRHAQPRRAAPAGSCCRQRGQRAHLGSSAGPSLAQLKPSSLRLPHRTSLLVRAASEMHDTAESPVQQNARFVRQKAVGACVDACACVCPTDGCGVGGGPCPAHRCAAPRHRRRCSPAGRAALPRRAAGALSCVPSLWARPLLRGAEGPATARKDTVECVSLLSMDTQPRHVCQTVPLPLAVHASGHVAVSGPFKERLPAGCSPPALAATTLSTHVLARR